MFLLLGVVASLAAGDVARPLAIPLYWGRRAFISRGFAPAQRSSATMGCSNSVEELKRASGGVVRARHNRTWSVDYRWRRCF